MLGLLKSFFDQKLTPDRTASDEERLQACQLAGAALMVELMESDHQLDERESSEFVRVLQETFSLDQKTVNEIVELARQQARQSTSLYEFTRLINDNYAYQDKVRLVANLWRLAYADDNLDKYEEGLIRRICDLIHVSHADFIQTKLRIRGNDS